MKKLNFCFINVNYFRICFTALPQDISLSHTPLPAPNDCLHFKQELVTQNLLLKTSLESFALKFVVTFLLSM